MDNTQLLGIAAVAAFEAGKKIIEVYNTSFNVENKTDNSPLTLADQNAHLKIVEFLEKTTIPILSEEGKHTDYSTRKEWNRLWIVDPLDGTKEFVKRNGEFTVNIALIENQKPVLGVIYAPVLGWLYIASKEEGAYKIENVGVEMGTLPALKELLITGMKLPKNSAGNDYVIVASRSHLSPETSDFIESKKKNHKKVITKSMGSSLKLCLVAEGEADIYPRFAPTMEWDTAAGQAIVECAGKTVMDYKTKQPVLYNRENLLNNWFVVE